MADSPDRPSDLAAAREHFRNLPRGRPRRVEPVGPGEESVWDYPRPPLLTRATRSVRVEFADRVVSVSDRALRVAETASPPVYYVPREDVDESLLVANERESFCEWKGLARYHDLRVGERVAECAAWSYPSPEREYSALRDHLAFYPGRVDACYLGDERVRPQPGPFYGGWVTDEIKGPFKGEPGTEGW